MKKTYQKPEAELIRFDLVEAMLDETVSAGNNDGIQGEEEW